MASAAALSMAHAGAATGEDGRRPAAVIALSEPEAAPKVVAYPPLAGPLARGAVIIQYRTEHLRVLPVFGDKAVAVSPRVGHLHVSVEGVPLQWAHTSGDPIIIVGLKPGEHKVRLDVADPSHKIITSDSVTFTFPDLGAPAAHGH